MNGYFPNMLEPWVLSLPWLLLSLTLDGPHPALFSSKAPEPLLQKVIKARVCILASAAHEAARRSFSSYCFPRCCTPEAIFPILSSSGFQPHHTALLKPLQYLLLWQKPLHISDLFLLHWASGFYLKGGSLFCGWSYICVLFYFPFLAMAQAFREPQPYILKFSGFAPSHLPPLFYILFTLSAPSLLLYLWLAWTCDLLPPERPGYGFCSPLTFSLPGKHLQASVLSVLKHQLFDLLSFLCRSLSCLIAFSVSRAS